MATNNVTIDFNNLNTYHPAYIWPKKQDVYFKAYPMVNTFFRVGLAGGLNGAAEAKSMADQFINGRANLVQGRMIGTLFHEWPVSFSPLVGTVTGPGVQSLTNTPVENTTKARVSLTRKTQPFAIPQDEWLSTLSMGDVTEQAKKALNQMNDVAADGLKTLLEDIENDLAGTGYDEDAGYLSLAAAIGTSATDSITYANISRSTISAWRGNFDAVTDANWVDETNADFCWNVIGKHLDTVMENGAAYDNMVIFMGATKYQYYRQSVQGPGVVTNARFDISGGGRSIPFADLYYGKVPVIYCPKLGASTAYIVDTETTFMVGLEGALFRLMDWTASENATQMYSRIHNIAQVVVTAPRRNVYIAAA